MFNLNCFEMRPKTRLQQEVFHLHKTCLSPAEEHKDFLIAKFDSFYTTHYKNFICLECNHLWKPQMDKWKEDIVGVSCPGCKKKLKYIKTESRGQVSRFVVGSIVETVGRFQVFRYISVWKSMDKALKPDYTLHRLFEEWIDYDKEKSTIVGRIAGGYRDGFTYSDYEIRYVNKSAYWSRDDYYLYQADYICPGARYLPRFDFYDLNNKTLDADPRLLLRKLKDSPKFETILKSGNKKLLQHAINNTEYSTYFKQIKTSFRHKYKIADPGVWFDFLKLLTFFKKDIHNPVVIFPKNLRKAHDELVKKKAKVDALEAAKRELIRQEKERAKAEAEEALRGIKETAFKGFKIKNGEIVIIPLIKEQDVKKEGDILKHCVHTNGYHNKSGILLMSARLGEKRLETIEISLLNYSILQCRGLGNKPTPYHDQIIDVVRRNMSKISRLCQKHKELKEINSKLQTEAA